MDDWSKAEDHAERARNFYQSGQWEKALAELKMALAVNPEQGDWHFGMGLTLDALERFDEALTAFEKALKLREDDKDTMLHLAVDCLRTSHTARAIEVLEHINRLDPQFEQGYCYRIAAYAQMGEHEQAEVMFYLARQVQEDCPLCYNHLAQSLAARGQFERAAYCWQKVKKIDANFPGVHGQLARLNWRRGRLDEAYESYLRELREDPGDLAALLEVGHVLLELGRSAEAAEKFRRVLELEPQHAQAHLFLGELSLAGEHLDAAQASLEKALALDANLPGVHLRLGQVALARGKRDVAWRQARMELARSPHHPPHALELARVLIELQKPKPVEDLLNAQLERAEARGLPREMRATMLMYRGVGRILLGKVDAGIADCRQALHLDRENILTLHNLILAYAHHGRFARARVLLRRATKLQPKDAQLKKLRHRVRWLWWKRRLGWKK